VTDGRGTAQRHPPLDVRFTEGLGRGQTATGKRAKLNLTWETRTRSRKATFSADAQGFKAVAGRPWKNVAQTVEQGNRCSKEPASKPDLPLAAAGRTALPSGEAEQRFALALWFIRGSLTFDMRGGLQTAKPAVRRPLDGRVRRSGHCLSHEHRRQRQQRRAQAPNPELPQPIGMV
jgi:hypothetical protein